KRGGVYNNSLERCARGARAITRSGGGTRKTLPHILATNLWFRKATRRRARRGETSHSGFFCAAARTPGSEYGSPRERAPAFLSAHVTQTFPNERAQPCHGN